MTDWTRCLYFLWAIIVLMLLAGCIPKSGAGTWSLIGSFPTVKVANHSLDPGRLYAVVYNSDRYIGTVMAGETRCLRLPFADMTYNLKFRSLSGEVTSAPFHPDRPGGWSWVVQEGLHSSDGLSLVPTPEPCR